MRFVRFGPVGRERPGVMIVERAGVCLDISEVVSDISPETIGGLGEITSRVRSTPGLPEVDVSRVRLGSPIGRPRKIIAIGFNYADHVAEAQAEIPTEPVAFMKATSSICGPDDDVVFPRGATKVDWEIELGVVVGSEGRYLDDEVEAEQSIAGYVVVNDVSERAFQLERGGQWMKGKSADTFTPVGPWLVTPDEIADPLDLSLSLSVNGEIRQNASTSTMIFSPAHCVWYLSQFMTLEPGDLIVTGTPPGVGLATGEYLEIGDVMKATIAGLGTQTQRCRGEEER